MGSQDRSGGLTADMLALGLILFVCVVESECATYWFTTAGPDTEWQAEKEDQDNMVALNLYRQGLATGDSEILVNTVAQYFNLVSLPGGGVVNKKSLTEFFNKFKSAAQAVANKRYFMYFDNIIHRQVGSATYEVSDWIIDDYTRGAHYSAARSGKVIWAMITKSTGKKCYPFKTESKCIFSIWT